MLFLLNNQVLDLDFPEYRLARRWRGMGCGDPHAMRAREAVEYAREIIDSARAADAPLATETALDLAALIVAKTGANAAQFVPRAQGPSDVRINTFSPSVLELFRAAQDDSQSPWRTASA